MMMAVASSLGLFACALAPAKVPATSHAKDICKNLLVIESSRDIFILRPLGGGLRFQFARADWLAWHARSNRRQRQGYCGADVASAPQPSGREMPRGGEAGERVGELFPIERLDQQTVHSPFQTHLSIFHH